MSQPEKRVCRQRQLFPASSVEQREERASRMAETNPPHEVGEKVSGGGGRERRGAVSEPPVARHGAYPGIPRPQTRGRFGDVHSPDRDSGANLGNRPFPD